MARIDLVHWQGRGRRSARAANAQANACEALGASLKVSAGRARPGAAPNSGSAIARAIAQLGLEPDASIVAQAIVTPPLNEFDPGNAGAFGATMQVKVSLLNTAGKVLASTTSAVLARPDDPDRRALTLPWPIAAHETNVFADRTGNPYAVRPHLSPVAGLFVDDIKLTPAQTKTGSGIERDIGWLAETGRGTRQPRAVLSAHLPAHADEKRKPADMDDLTLRLWSASAPGRESKPYTIRKYEKINAELRRARERAKRGNAYARDAGFAVPAQGSLEAALGRAHREAGWAERAPGDGMMTERDVLALIAMMNDPKTPAPERRVQSLSNQRLITAIDSARDAIARGVERAIGRGLGTTDERGATIDETETMVNIDADTGLDGAEHGEEITRRLAEVCANQGASAQIEHELIAWRRHARAVRIPHRCSTAERDSIRRTVLQTSHRLTRGPDDFVTPVDLTPAPMAALFMDLSSTSHNTRPGKAATTHGAAAYVIDDNGQRLPAITVENVATGATEDRSLASLVGETIEIVTTRGVNLIKGDRPAAPGAAAKWRIADAAVLESGILREIPLATLADSTRISMAVSMGEAALAGTGGSSEPVVRAKSVRGNLSDNTLPIHRMRVAAYDGHYGLFEDGCLVSRSAAESVRLLLPQTINHERHRPGETGREYVGGEAASFEDAVNDIPDLTRERFDKIGDDGVIKEDEIIEPGDIVQLWYEHEPDPAGGQPNLRYGADFAPGHGRRRVVGVVIEDNPGERGDEGSLGPDGLLKSVMEATSGEEADWDRGERTVRINTIEETAVDTGFKITTMHATKGMVTIVPDDEMPCTADGIVADVVISGYSMSARMAPADMVEIRLGHLLETRTAMIDDALERLAAGEAGAWTERHQRYAETLSAPDRADGRTTLAEAIGADREVPGRANAARMLRRLRGVSRERAQASRVGIEVAHAPGREEIVDIENALDYVLDEECSITYANSHDRALGRELASPAMCGMTSVMMLRHLGRKSEKLAPLDRCDDGIHPGSGQRRGSRRLGMMEGDAMSASGAVRARDEQRALADADARENADALHAKGVPSDAREADAAQRFERTFEHWNRALGFGDANAKEGHNLWRFESDDDRRAHSTGAIDERALEPAYDSDNNAIAERLADSPGMGPLRHRHIELPVPIVHPLALETGPGKSTPALAVLLGMNQGEPRKLAARERAPGGGNGPARIAAEIEAIEMAIATDPERLKAQAERLAPRAAQQARALIDTLVANPAIRLSDAVMHSIAVPDARVRPVRHGGAPHPADAHIRRILTTARDARAHPEEQSATRRLSWAVYRYFAHIEQTLYGKRALLNRAGESPRVGISASGAIVPGDAAKLGAHLVEVSPRAALALSAHDASTALAESEGLTREQARARLGSLNERTLRNPSAETERAWETLRRAAALTPKLVTRSPALHASASVAMELKVRDPRDHPGVNPDEDTTIAFPPWLCEGQNADYDGDNVALYGCVGPGPAADARRQAGPGRHMHRIGTGAAQGLPRQAPAAGLLHSLARASTPFATLSGWLEGDVLAQRLIERARRKLPEGARTRFADRRPGEGVKAGDLRALASAMHPKNAAEEGALGRIYTTMWDRGIKGCREAPVNLSLGSFDAFAEVWALAKEQNLLPALRGHKVPPPLAANTTSRQTTQFELAAAERFEAVNRSIVEWVNDPQRMLDTATKLNCKADGERAMSVLRALAGGGRLKASHVARSYCEAGGPTRLTGRSYGVYVSCGIFDGANAGERRIQMMGGAEGKVSNHAVVARAGHLSQRIGQAVAAGTAVVQSDCGADPKAYDVYSDAIRDDSEMRRHIGSTLITEAPIALDDGRTLHHGDTLSQAALQALAGDPNVRTLRLDPLSAEKTENLDLCTGAMLARNVDLGQGERWTRGRTLDTADIARAKREDLAIVVRDLAHCESKGGICGACSGHLAARERAAETGTELGVTAATSLAEIVTQPAMNAFHLGQIVGSASIEQRGIVDALMSGLGLPPWAADDTFDGEVNAKDPKIGAISLAADHGRAERGAVGARRSMGKAIIDIATAAGVDQLDPTLVRVVAHGLCADEHPDLDRAAARSSSRRYAASGRSPRTAARVLADPHASEWESPKARSARLEAARDRDPEYRLDAHRAAARDDIEALKEIAQKRPEALTAEDGLGWTPLHLAHSGEAAALLMRGRNGCDPAAPARHDPRGFTPLELMTVKPIATRAMKGKSLGERRSAVLREMLSHMSGQEAKRIVENDPVLARALKPLGDAKRAERRARKRGETNVVTHTRTAERA